MRSLLAALTLVGLVACGGADDAPDTADDMADAVADAAPTLADFDGTWELTATLDGTPDPVAVRMEGSAAGGWTMTLPDRDPMPVTASLSGDSLVTEVAPYESVIRAGVTVSTRSAVVLTDDGRMMGALVATYRTPDGDEVVRGTLTGGRGGM